MKVQFCRMWKLTVSALVVFSFLTGLVYCTKTVLVEPGASVSLECQRRTDTALVWDKAGSTTGAIAIDGSVQVNLLEMNCLLHYHVLRRYPDSKHTPCALKRFEFTTISISWHRANKETPTG